MIDKREIRRRIKNMRLVLTQKEKMRAAESVFERLEKSAPFLMANHILLYHSLPDELYTHSFLKKWGNKKHFYLPRVNGVNLEILPYEQSRLELGSFHIEEPAGDDLVDPSILELIVTPGVAFSRKGARLGRGKGYYDRLLAETKATKVGVAYHFQLLDEIPIEPHDIPVDIVITDEAVYITSEQ
ncbi:MAG: 5-formyltetrahydrofolate cyclo-ligase [Lachnospiraceae bacterium]|nr:5-formyltetrahydrofolate cyclo-ligase [Prevotella sp.]MCM1075124.1 5-formyltetrahydrofolate cyclo-ligase [Ruminococcus sp.]MCM1225577.1 5-formyltetrahydrofolate cyclo-ligase [Lachnospiraceae bacterium]